MKFDFGSASTEVLINPRLPEDEKKLQAEALARLPALPGHFWVSTSGSSGRRKWVALSKKAILASAAGVNSHLASDPGSKDVWLDALPSFHVGGLGIWARAYLSKAKVLDMAIRYAKWNAPMFQGVAEEAKVTLSALVPAQVYDLVQNQLEAPKTLRAVIVGGGALSEKLYIEARKLGWKLLPSYGLTECSSQVATASLDSLGALEFPRLKILPHVEARISAEGLIQLKSEALLTGYGVDSGTDIRFEDPKRDGWFTTEDCGEVLEGGFLKVEGRKGSFLKIGGENVDLWKLELVFEETKLGAGFGADALLVEVPDERLGQVIHLVHSSGNAEDVANLVGAFNGRVLPVERIRKSHFFPEIPRSPVGKILKPDVLRLISEKSSPKSS